VIKWAPLGLLVLLEVGYPLVSGPPRAVLVAATVLVGQVLVGWHNDLVDRTRDAARLPSGKPIADGYLDPGTAWFALVCGVLLGLAAGYYGRWVDAMVTMVIDVMLAFPGILLALALVSVLGPSLRNLMIAVGISSVPTYARLVRGSVLSSKENVYVEAARVIGCTDVAIMRRHVLPNVVAPIIVVATLGVAAAILWAAALSFLGLGSQPPTPEWGRMLSEGRNFLREQWWIATFPGLAIMITVLSMNLLGDGLRDVLDPRQQIRA
jgi:peptide/nickel transport system permease protein